MRVCRVHTDEITDDRLLAEALLVCTKLGIGFYYSGKQRVIRAQTRSVRRLLRLEREMNELGIGITKSYY